MYRISLYSYKISFLSLIIFNLAAYVRYVKKKTKLLYSLGDYTYKKLNYYETTKVETADCSNLDNAVFSNISSWVLIISDSVE